MHRKPVRGIPVHRVPEAEWDIVYNTHEPIVSQALFDRVQEVNEAGANAYKAVYGTCSHLPTRSNPYREKLVCADCGTRLKLYRSMSNDRKKAYFVYICPTYEEHRELRCTKKSIRCDDLNAAVLQALRVQIELFCNTQTVLMKLAEKRISEPVMIQRPRARYTSFNRRSSESKDMPWHYMRITNPGF